MLSNHRIAAVRALAGIVLGLALLAGSACDTCSSGEECGAGTCCVNGRCIDDCDPEDQSPTSVKVKASDEAAMAEPTNLHEIVQLLFPPMH